MKMQLPFSKDKVPFNKPYLSGNETDYIEEAVRSGKISGDGVFTKKCHQFFKTQYGFKNNLLTTSCTDALEMSAILSDIKLDDEVILPSYTFVSTANAFVLRGAKLVFADSNSYNPNIDADSLENLITEKTKVIVLVHYAGIACDMDRIIKLANKYGLIIVEDAAQAIDSYYKGKPLGGFGDFACFSFHETKNIISGEGGLLLVKDNKVFKRAEIIREKGTNRSAFFRGEVDKYSWVDIGSSFLPSDIIAAFLFAQLENLKKIQTKRKIIWNSYNNNLSVLKDEGYFDFIEIPKYATNNAHLFCLICKTLEERNSLIKHLKKENIWAVFHYLSLHKSPYYKEKYYGPELPNSDRYADTLVRLPLYYELTETEQEKVIQSINNFYKG